MSVTAGVRAVERTAMNTRLEGDTKALSTWQLVAYGQVVVPLAIIGLPLAIYIPPFYSQTLGLDLASVGFILLIARLADVFIDPMVGHFSDSTHTRWGRRRPWVLAGVPVMMVSAFMLLVPQGEVTNLYLFIWICAIYLGFTLITIPYGAWGAELSGDYHERNRITGSREIFLLVGLLMAITAPILGGYQSGADAAPKAAFHAMAALGWMTVILTPVGAFFLLLFVPEPYSKKVFRMSLRKGLRIAMRNGPFRLILYTTILGSFAGSLNASVAIFFFDHIANLGKSASALIFVLFLSGVIGSPFWVRIGGRIGKHKAIVIAGTVSMVAFAAVPVLIYVVRPVAPDLVIWGMFAITIIQGLSIGAAPILGQSMMADVVDLDTLKSGEQRAGFMIAFVSMLRKAFEAAGLVALPILAWAGFDPMSYNNTPAANFTLLAMYCLAPMALWSITIVLISRYPITQERQVRLRLALEKKLVRKRAAALALEQEV